MIITNPTKLSPAGLFKILALRYLRKRWWLLAWMWVLAVIIGLQETYDNFSLFLIVFSLIYPLLIILILWRFVTAKDNKILFLERHYEIDNDRITGIIDQDTYSLTKIEHFIKAELIQGTYLLYLSKSQFMYIPIDSFRTSEDKLWFEKEVLSKIRK